jgi:pimeloyl-ACP methyl ester carboxylesterase
MGWPIRTVERGTRPLAYSVAGEGLPLLLPLCNLNWFDFCNLDELARRRRVIVASPFGFGRSGRDIAGTYVADDFIEDLLFVCDLADADRFSVFGYSLTAAIAARLASVSDRVTAVVAGGFPLLGSYQAVSDGVAEHLREEPGVVEQLWEQFDARAVAALYRSIANLPAGDLVDSRTCPMHAFWGDDDQVLRGFDTSSDLRSELAARGVDVTTVGGADHDSLLLQLDAVLATVP